MAKQTEFIYNLLRITYSTVPILAGLDKFTNLLTDWGQYLSPGFADMLPLDGRTFLMTVGLVEFTAGIIVLFNTKIGSIIVSVWLILIALVLVFSGNHFDIAVRDIVMAIGAFVLFKLSDLQISENKI